VYHSDIRQLPIILVFSWSPTVSDGSPVFLGHVIILISCRGMHDLHPFIRHVSEVKLNYIAALYFDIFIVNAYLFVLCIK
jgi:hypothetical protein